MKLKIMSLVLFLIMGYKGFSQEKKAVFEYQDTPLKTVLIAIEKAFDVNFSYKSDLIENITITIDKRTFTLNDILFELEFLTSFNFNKLGDNYYFLSKKMAINHSDILINGYLTKGIVKTSQANYTINSLSFGVLAGLTETDILESIQQLPGVLSINETATELNVRGGNIDQNNVIWDGIPIYHSGHLFGMVTVFNPNISNKVHFYNKGTNAKYGEKIASVISINTATKIAQKTKIEVGLNGISFDGLLELPLIKDKLSLQTSYRRSFEDIFETATFKAYENKVFENTKIIDESFKFSDYNIKLNYKPNAKNLITFSHIYIDNDLQNEVLENDNIELHNDVLDSENDGFALCWDYNFTNKFRLKTNISYSHYRSFYNDIKKENNLFLSEYTKRNNIDNKLLTTQLFWNFSDTSKFDFGYQHSIKNVTYIIKELKDVLYTLENNKAKENLSSSFVNYHFKDNNWTLYSGFRLSYYANLNAFRFEPRLVVTRKINNNIKLQITGEIKNQSLNQINESIVSDLSLDRKIWRLSDGHLNPIVNGKQISGSLILNKGKWSSDVDFYIKQTNGISSLTLGYLNPIDNNFHLGKQKINGFDFYLKRNLKHFKTYVSYSFIDMESKFEGVNNNEYFTSNNEIHHAISTSVNYHTKNLDIVLGWKFRSGKPITNINYDINGTAYFDAINDNYLPNYHRLDISATYKFSLFKKQNIRSKIGLSIRNIYNNKSHIGTQYFGGNSLDEPFNIIKTHSIGFTPNMSFRVYW